MKIAFLIYQDINTKRGVETYVRELSKRLALNHEVKILSANKSLPNRWPILKRFYIDPFGIKIALFTITNLRWLLSSRPQILICINGGFQSLICRLVTFTYGGKLIISGQSGLGWDDRINLFCFPNKFVALTNYQKKWAENANPFIKSVVIPNGVDINKFKKTNKSFEAKLKKPIILCVSALVPNKRLDLLIHAVSQLDNASLLIVGDGPEKNKLLNLGEQLLPNRLEIRSVDHQQMPSLYKIADLFTFPTVKWESFGIVLVEAMASGLGIVTNDDPIRREIVGEAGLFVNPENTEEYSKALKKALNINWHKKATTQASKFSWDKIVNEYEELFINLTNK
jgi:glycosyltransferase involved in cell wall biosynthesis